ncbi:hypothetical protein H0H92_000681 [Tricholoma furcatifolium]|nr:hypothetical protein H0H92_000681 [Tricholoma furcatifolium]
MDGPAHLLTLKVMRVSRPELASAWQPFYSSSPSFSAHSTASVVSLQGIAPLPGHPKTLRDLTHVSELLTLPSSFGAIQLGETFSSCLCINNEAQMEIGAVSIKVEMQTATTKVILAEFGGLEHKLSAKETFENIVHHEIKELGQHVLACAVTYRYPPNRQLPSSGEHVDDPSLQTFRKFYKFSVTNPLSVKTKVHVPRSPSALLSRTEREKVFLEVHIQNLTQEPMHFEKMHLECTDEWEAEDVNLLDDATQLFSGPQALMQPQDTRQYIYILTPKSTSLTPVALAPGTIVPLGRLDIFWRSSFGEPGRLLTSMLSRRIPIPPPVQTPASAVPPHLKRSITTGPPSRPQSPQPNQSRPGTPPPPGPSPSQSRTPSSISPSIPPSPFQPLAASLPELEVGLLIRDIPHDSIRVDNPFKVLASLVFSSSPQLGREKWRRVVKVSIQHLQPPRGNALQAAAAPASRTETFSPRLPSSGFSTPSSRTANSPTFNYAIAHQKLAAVASPRQQALSALEGTSALGHDEDTIVIPPPYFKGTIEHKLPKTVLYSGSSALYLPSVELSYSHENARLTAIQDFELTFIPTQKGFATVGGLRVLLINDRLLDTTEAANDDCSSLSQARILKEWEVISEIWVSS